MYILYTLPASQDCFDVRSVLYDLNIEYIERDVINIRTLNELRELVDDKGDVKRDVPVLYFKDKKKIYKGKKDIIEYLSESFGEDRYRNLI